VFGVRDFRLLFAGQTISSIGDQIFPVAVAIKVLDTGGSASALGLVLGARVAALVIFVVAGGVWADRLPRTHVMICSDALRGLAVLGLALTPGDVPLWLLTALVFLVGGGEAFFRPAYGAVVPSVVAEEQLPAANALTSISQRTAAIAGPAIGGAVVGLAGGVRTAFVLDALTFAASLLTLLRIREPTATPRNGPRVSAVREALEGVRAVRDRPWIAAVLIMASLQLMFTIAPENVLLPIVSREKYGGDRSFGFALTMMAVGGVAGALISSRWQPRRVGLAAQLGILPYALIPLAMAFSSSRLVLFAAFFAAGLGLEPFLVYWTSALQREVPRELLARVISLDWLCSLALMPLGFALTGPAVSAFGRTAVLVTGAVVIVVTTLGSLAVRGVMEYAEPGRGAAHGGRDAALDPAPERPHPTGHPDLTAGA
jgi:MFS family permease